VVKVEEVLVVVVVVVVVVAAVTAVKPATGAHRTSCCEMAACHIYHRSCLKTRQQQKQSVGSSMAPWPPAECSSCVLTSDVRL
jgi:hypothetical protein